MTMSVVKVPFGPEYVLYEGEFYAVARHRIMIFFYFGLVCMILVASMGSHSDVGKPELIMGLAAIAVFVGFSVVLASKRLAAWWAARTGTITRVRLGWVLVATVTSAVASAEVIEPFLIGTPPSTPLEFTLKLAFYLTVTELLTSIMLQYTLGYILKDLRKGKHYAADGRLLTPAPETPA